MSSPTPPGPASPRPSSHRAPSPASQLIRKATPPLAAVTAVVAVIVILLIVNSRPSSSGPAPGAVSEHPASMSSTQPASARTSSSPAASPSSTPPAPPVTEPPATQTPTRSATQPAKLPVTVLNNSRLQHLAAHVAAELAAKGWPIRKTGNFTGRIIATTVYYAAGERAAAVRLANQFGQIRRIEPRFRGLPGSGLTLVVTRDWSS